MTARRSAASPCGSAAGSARSPSPPGASSAGTESSPSTGADGLGGEAVADAEVRVDVAPARRHALELLAQLADEDVDRAVAVDHRVAPHALVDLLALQHLPLRVGEQLDELELAPREVGADAADEGLELVGADLDLADRDAGPSRPRVSARLRRRTTASTRAISSSGWHGFVTQSSAPRRSPRTRWATDERPVQTTTPRPGRRAHSFSR